MNATERIAVTLIFVALVSGAFWLWIQFIKWAATL